MAIKQIKFNWPGSIPEHQFDHQFIQGMLDRVAVGFHNYGDNRRTTKRPDCIKSMKMRIKKYKQTKNTEYLMDAANFLMMEFMVPSVRNAFFESTTKQASPGAAMMDGRIVKGKEEM